MKTKKALQLKNFAFKNQKWTPDDDQEKTRQFGGMLQGNTKLQNYVALFLYFQVPML